MGASNAGLATNCNSTLHVGGHVVDRLQLKGFEEITTIFRAIVTPQFETLPVTSVNGTDSDDVDCEELPPFRSQPSAESDDN